MTAPVQYGPQLTAIVIYLLVAQFGVQKRVAAARHSVRYSFDNNSAEREVRMVRLRQKVSGCLRTLAGAQQFCAIRSYLATAAKHSLNLLHALARLAAGEPWLPTTQATT